MIPPTWQIIGPPSGSTGSNLAPVTAKYSNGGEVSRGGERVTAGGQSRKVGRTLRAVAAGPRGSAMPSIS